MAGAAPMERTWDRPHKRGRGSEPTGCLVQVDGFLVQSGERRRKGGFGDYGGLAREIHHHEVVARDGAQAGGVGGVR